MKKALITAGCLGALAFPAFAQDYMQFDRNGDGVVTFQELRRNGVRVTRTLRAADVNRDKVLSRWELSRAGLGGTAYYNRYNTYGSYNPYYQAPTSYGYHWSTIDLNRNGVLEPYELQQAGYSNYGNYTYNMYNVDLNRDGYIDAYEAQRAGYTGNTWSANNTAGWLNLLLNLPGLIR